VVIPSLKIEQFYNLEHFKKSRNKGLASCNRLLVVKGQSISFAEYRGNIAEMVHRF